MAKAPRDIKFAPLNKEKEYTAEELMTLYEVSPARLVVRGTEMS